MESARHTAMRAAIGAITKGVLKSDSVEVLSHVRSVRGLHYVNYTTEESKVKSEERSLSRRGDPLPFVVMTGFMGTGKTETGRSLAELLCLEFVDLNHLITSRAGMTIAEIFETNGEAHFRALEEEACEEIAECSGIVVATGAETLLSEKNRRILSQRGQIVLLEASAEAILERVGRERTRTLLYGAGARSPQEKIPDPPGEAGPPQPDTQRAEAPREDSPDRGGESHLRDRILDILNARRSVYSRIGLRMDTTHLNPREAACRIAPSIEIPSRTITIRVPAGSMRPIFPRSPGSDERKAHPAVSTIEIGRGILSKLGERLQSLGLGAGAFLLMPRKLRSLYLDQISASLDTASIPWNAVSIRDRDTNKNLHQLSDIIDTLARRGAERDAAVVTIGGGVTGDIGGLAASVYMRGIHLVHIPTTLLAQADSSIGGKVGVHHPRANNLVGSYYQPHLVLIDPCALRTLEDREVSNGMAEVVKTAMAGSADLLDYIERELSTDPRRKLRDIAFLERCVTQCAAVKASIVERDPFEQDERRLLNLGHTLGHALEAAKAYPELAHGEAVSIGLIAATRIAVERRMVSERFLERIRAILGSCGLATGTPHYDEAALARNLRLDKKKRSGRYHFVLPVRVGATVGVTVVDDVTEAEMLTSIRKGVAS